MFQCLEQILYSCVENGIIQNVQCDTYTRELERYGEKYIEEIEALFCVNSRSVIGLLRQTKQSETSENDRWKLSLLLIDNLMTAFSYALEDKKALVEKMSTNFKTEFGFTSSTFTKQLNDKYRRLRSDVDIALERQDESLNVYANVLANRRLATTDIAMRFDYDIAAKNDLLYSLIHMTMNRVFRSKNRLHEMVIYDFLLRYYQSKIAKEKYKR